MRAGKREIGVGRTERRVRLFGKWFGIVAVGFGIVAMTACSGTVQDRLGMTRRAPDEFQVVRRQPLVIPPDYRLPEPGTSSPAQQADTASRDARAALFGGFSEVPGVGATGPSQGEQVLLAAVPGTAIPDIRDIILSENTELTQLDESRFLFILDFQRRAMSEGRAVENPLDPAAEAARLEAEGVSERVITRRVGSSVVQ